MFTVDDDGTLRFRNGVDCGVIYREVDGYFVWGAPEGRGFWESGPIRAIADLLDDMNLEWNKTVQAAQH